MAWQITVRMICQNLESIILPCLAHRLPSSTIWAKISQTKKWDVFPSFGSFFGQNIPDLFCHRCDRRKSCQVSALGALSLFLPKTLTWKFECGGNGCGPPHGLVCISQTRKWEVFPSFGSFFGLNIPDLFCHCCERNKSCWVSAFGELSLFFLKMLTWKFECGGNSCGLPRKLVFVGQTKKWKVLSSPNSPKTLPKSSQDPLQIIPK